MATGTRRPIWIEANSPPNFPNPQGYSARGLLAGGGDLSSARLLAAYRSGIFPWYDEEPILWWCPDPRAVMEPSRLHVSRSLSRLLGQGQLRVTCNLALPAVLAGCADRADGTWLNAEMRAAYLLLGDQGAIQSYEVWLGEALVGGLYGVLLGGLFAAESMFHRVPNASKVALVASVRHLFAAGVQVYDVQFVTAHLASMGARTVPRVEYLRRVSQALERRLDWPDTGGDANLLPWVVTQQRAMVSSAPHVWKRG